MLEVSIRESYAVTEVINKSDGLYLRSEYGLLRLSPQSDSIIRVSFTGRVLLRRLAGLVFCHTIIIQCGIIRKGRFN